MSVRICSHTRHDGTRCGAIALRHKSLCQYHQRSADRDTRRLLLRDRHALTADPRIELPAIEDRASAMAAVNEIMQAFAIGLIDRVTARALFSGVQVCFNIIKNAKLLPDVQKSQTDNSLCEHLLQQLAKRNKSATCPNCASKLASKNSASPSPDSNASKPATSAADAPISGDSTPVSDIQASIERGLSLHHLVRLKSFVFKSAASNASVFKCLPATSS